MNQTVGNVGRRSKHKFLPLLVFLFAVSYGLLTTLVVLQDRTIDAQSGLIHLLFKESRQLNVMAAKNHPILATRERQKQDSGAAQVPSAQVPRVQVPSPQVQQKQNVAPVPSSQEKASTKAGKNQHKAGKRSPMPPAETTDPSDMRRTLYSI